MQWRTAYAISLRESNILFFSLAVVCILVFPAAAFAQLPATTYGWNLGNTLEPPSGEGTWNNPAVTQAMINAVADAGFNSIRIPVAWDSHANQSTYAISSSWLNRVKQVVDWSLDAGLTTVINTHWDGGWLENNIGSSVNSTINAKMDSYWTQIADTFSGASYDERLLFAAANEPNVSNASQMSTLTTYYQTFVDAVRGEGGSNTSRWLVLQGPNTNIDLTDSLMNTLPTDSTADRLAVEVHYYDPWQFAGLESDQSWGDMFYFWGDDYDSSTQPDRNATHSEEDWLENQLQKMNDKFVSQGIPVILGEFGATDRRGNPDLTGSELDLHLESRLYYHQLVADTANSLGIAPFYWDNGDISTNNGQGSGIFNRYTESPYDQDTVDVLTPDLAPPTGDYNGDGVIDGADYTMWRDTEGMSVTVGTGADGSGPSGVPDGVVDEWDFDVWVANFGEVIPSGAGAGSSVVPEPASWLLVSMAGMGLVGFGGRRRTSSVARG